MNTEEPVAHSFELVVFEEITDEYADALFSSGCDDCTPARINGENVIMFDRVAPTIDAAIDSAVEAVQRVGLTIKETRRL